VPDWESFTKGAFINCDELEEVPITGWDRQISKDFPSRPNRERSRFFQIISPTRPIGEKENSYDSFGAP